jgi:hypothetical protein
MRKNIAIVIALIADGLQVAVTPLITVGGLGVFLDVVIDLVTAVIMILLLGFHWAFLPSFLVELIPGVSLVPLWTLAAILATKREAKASETTVVGSDRTVPVPTPLIKARPLNPTSAAVPQKGTDAKGRPLR